MNQEDNYDAGDVGQVKKRKTKAQLRRETEIAQLQELLNTKAGRAVLWRVLEKCGMYKESFTGNSTTFYNCGRQSIGYWLLTELVEADKRAYIKMQEEALNG